MYLDLGDHQYFFVDAHVNPPFLLTCRSFSPLLKNVHETKHLVLDLPSVKCPLRALLYISPNHKKEASRYIFFGIPGRFPDADKTRRFPSPSLKWFSFIDVYLNTILSYKRHSLVTDCQF
jgi:hypothetical protein